MKKKDLAGKLEKVGSYCLFITFVIIVILFLVPFLIQNNIFGIGETFGCVPTSDVCCAPPYHKPSYTGLFYAIKCFTIVHILFLLSLILFVIGIAASILSWILKRKKK